MFKKFKKTDFYKNYAKMLKYVIPYKKRVILAVVITLPIGAMDAVIAWSLKPYLDVIMLKDSVGSFKTAYIPLIIILFSAFQSVLTYSSTYLNTWTGQKISQDVKRALFNKLMRYTPAFFDNQNSGYVLTRFSGDVDTACAGLLNNFRLFLTRLFSSLALIGVLLYNSWQLALFAIVVLGVALYPMTTLKKRIKGFVKQSVFSGSAVTTHYNEVYSGNRIVSSYNLYDFQNQKFDKSLNEVFRLGMKTTQRTGLVSPLMHFIVSLGIAGVIWLGSYLIVSGSLTAGGFVSFITALIMLYTPIKGIGANFNAVQLAVMAMERVFEMLETTPDIVSKPKAVKLKGLDKFIEYKDVCFEYEKDKPILKNINLKVKKGQTIAFVGNSGGGKTTMASILPRFYDVQDGAIEIDGVNIKEFNLDSLRDNIAIVFQDNFLFSGSIKDNILIGNQKASQKEIDVAIQSACLTEFVESLENGLDTNIGERGALLSGGQKQRIAIARAFLKNAPIVILDEATSALDNKSELVVQQAIENLMKDRTVFVIAHRLSTIRNADKIVVINQGEIVETGSHKQLLGKENSVYASLYKTQIK